METLPNPGRTGPEIFDTIIYGPGNVNYAGVPALAQYNLYDAPDPAYVTGRIDISAFANLGSAPWPFANTNVPLNGTVCVPQGRGPFPLVVFAHGNHDPFVNSSPGYMYLCELLASRGIIAATIDVNFLNGFNWGENDARAIVHLEHLKQFRAWTANPAHPLHGKVDLNRILIVGHSRGGEGVGHASFFNRLSAIQPTIFSPIIPLDGSVGLGPYRFGLTAIAAIAPTDNQYQPVTGPTVVPDTYFVIHGSRDGDVSTFSGYDTYNRAHAVDLANPTVSDGKLKALLWVYGANHNQFNRTWPSEWTPIPPIPRSSQEQIAKVQFGVLAEGLLLDRSKYVQVLRDHSHAVAWMPSGSDFVSQYQDPHRIFIEHNQEGLGAPQVSLPVQGTVLLDGVIATRGFYDLVNSGGPQQTISLRLEWNNPRARFLVRIDPATLPAERYKVLALRIGQSTAPKNVANRDQDFTIEVSSGSRTAAIPASSIHRLLYPDVIFGAGKIVMQSLRLPFRRLREMGIEPSDLRAVSLVFNRRPRGVLYLGELQVSN